MIKSLPTCYEFFRNVDRCRGTTITMEDVDNTMGRSAAIKFGWVNSRCDLKAVAQAAKDSDFFTHLKAVIQRRKEAEEREAAQKAALEKSSSSAFESSGSSSPPRKKKSKKSKKKKKKRSKKAEKKRSRSSSSDETVSEGEYTIPKNLEESRDETMKSEVRMQNFWRD